MTASHTNFASNNFRQRKTAGLGVNLSRQSSAKLRVGDHFAKKIDAHVGEQKQRQSPH
jgi:hypothetical protein